MLTSVEQRFIHITNKLQVGEQNGKLCLLIENGPRHFAVMNLTQDEYNTFLVHLKRQAELTFGVKS